MTLNRLQNASCAFTLALGLTSLCGCATRPSAPPPPPARGPAWVADQIEHPTGAWRVDCIGSSLATSYALVAFRDGHVDDDTVSRDLVHGANVQPLLQLRSEEGTLWHRTHDPAAVAAYHLTSCMRWDHVELSQSPAWRACLQKTEAVALLSLYRSTGRTRPAAVAAGASQFAGDWSPAAIQIMADRVYAAPTAADDLRIRKQVLGDCLANAAQ